MGPARTPLVIVAALLTALWLVACGDEKASEQKPKTVNGEGFTVQMPGTAERSVSTVRTAAGPIRVTAYISESGSDAFSISVGRLPAGTRGDLRGAISGAAATTGGTVAEATATRYAGFPARDARVTGVKDRNGNQGTVFVRVILAKNQLFQLQFVQEGEDVTSPPKSYDAFVASLRIT